MSKLLDGNHPFGRRCTAALTHPVTISALGLLLLNDLVFKALWSNPSTTGKVSDLAWVVFASPLLAFLLSPIARRSRLAERIVFVTAYAGLPVLYAAFNTFPVVHDAILWALSFAGGTGVGAPHDPADSLVIPFGLAIAVWVWRRDPPESNSPRMRFGLLIAGIAALASVASTPPEPVVGVTAVEVEPDGTFVGSRFDYEGGFEARDEPFRRSVETPRGTFTIEGPNIVRIHDGERTVAYTAAYLNEGGNFNMQTWATRSYGVRKIATEPYSLTYDESSGNVIAAMGLQGAVVGTPDGKWTRVAVGNYIPNDFSSLNKLSVLLDWNFWLPALALSFSFAGIGMVLPEAGSQHKNKSTLIFAIIAIIVSLLGLLFSATINVPDDSGLIDENGLFTFLMTLLTQFFSAVGLFMSLVVVIVSTIDLWTRTTLYGRKEPSNSNFAKDRRELLLAIPASLAGMLALNSLLILLWVQMGLHLVLAKLSAVVLVTIVAWVLHGYLSRMVRRNPLH